MNDSGLPSVEHKSAGTGFSVTALVLGILSLILAWFYIVNVSAIVFGIIGVIVLTAAVDVQDNRFEVEVRGWGRNYESWGIYKNEIYGELIKHEVWDDEEMGETIDEESIQNRAEAYDGEIPNGVIVLTAAVHRAYPSYL